MPAQSAHRRLPEPEPDEADLVRGYCSICHAVPNVRLHTGDEWDAVMSEMDRHIVLSDVGLPMCVGAPSAAQFDAIREYLRRHAR